MEIKSEPKYETVQVTDLDIAYPGDLVTLTLWPGDVMERTGDTLTVTFKSGGTRTFRLQHAHWFAQLTRGQRVVVQETKAVTE